MIAPCKSKLDRVEDVIVWQRETAKRSHWMECFSFVFSVIAACLHLQIFWKYNKTI